MEGGPRQVQEHETVENASLNIDISTITDNESSLLTLTENSTSIVIKY